MAEEIINERDQWKLDGECGKCRRKDYCGKPCRAMKCRVSNKLMQAYANYIVEHMPKKEGGEEVEQAVE